MKVMTLARLSSSGLLLLFLVLGTFVPRWLSLAPASTWILRVLLWTLGLAGALLLFFHLRARAKAVAAAAPDDEVDAAVDTARKRLPASARLGKAPVLLVLGPTGSAKTTVVQRSGLDAELLAGEIQRNQNVVPSTVNLWYTSDAIITEAGGRVLADPNRWGRLLDRLVPDRLAAVFARGRQAPRLAVVCVSCEDFTKPGGAQAVSGSAQLLRERLVEAANRFGVRLPVYVLFTKADRLPYFTDFVRSFTREEAAEVLGATLPLAPASDPGHHKEAESARVGDAFGRLLGSLSSRRTDVLPRETTEQVRAGAYEFPRELGKMSALATQFLTELCRPAQIGVAPFLRGFYFTGVRPLIVSEAAQPMAPQPVAAGGVGAVDATAVFDPRAMLAAAQQSASAPAGSRRVPDWTFLPRLFRDVVLADRVAMGVTAGGARVNLLRRIVLATATLAFLLLAGAFFTSWLSNRRLIGEAHAAAATVQGVDFSGVGLPVVEDLARLDSLRSVTARLRAWDTTTPPLRFRWGLYSGDAVLPELRRLYFHRFGRMLWEGARGNMVGYLQALPDTPTAASQYDTAFSALKAYIITSEHPEYSTPEFLSPVLMHHWPSGREVDADRAALATSQFDFFATELPRGNPFDAPQDADMIARSRRFLAQFGDSDRLYQTLLNQASANANAIQFHRVVPGSENVLRNDYTVQGAFTKEGWSFVQANVDRVDQFFANDAWVLGDQTVSPADRARLALELRRRYTEDYVRVWTEYLASSRVAGFSGAADAARKLAVLSDPRSPLLQLLAIASSNTDVDTTDVRAAFQPVHAVLPPSLTDRFVDPANEGYVAGLAELARSMEQVASARGAEQQNALAQVEGTADRVETTVTQMALGFASQGDATAVGSTVRRLLQAPIENVQPLVAQVETGEVNGKGAAFCRDASPVLRKYPFAQTASTVATLEEIDALFKPGGSAFSTLVDGLQDVIVAQGSEYRARPGVQRAPTGAFMTMLNRMKRVSDGLYGGAAQTPTVEFSFTPLPTEAIPEVTVSIDGRNHTATRTQFTQTTFRWQLQNAREARITGRSGENQNLNLVSYNEPWALFRLFGQASWEASPSGLYRLSWTVNPGGTVSADLRFPRGIPIFSPNEIGNLTCVPRVVQ